MVAPALRIPSILLLISAAACSSSSSPETEPTTARPMMPVAPPAATDMTPAAPPNAFAESIDALFTEAEAKDAFSGSVIVIDGGKQVFEKGYGFADRTAKRKNAPDTLFRIGSISKQFAASAILALVQDGKLALTDPVSKFFPDYPKENLVSDGVEVTVHHLLSHTSGLPDPYDNATLSKAVWRRVVAPAEQVDSAKTMPLVRKPGSAWEYQNYNFCLAALIVEKTSGQAYESFLKKRFFEPLGMNDTGTIMPASDASRAAVGYADDKTTGERYTLSDDPAFKDRDVSFAFGSGQIYSTVRDLAKWDRALAGTTVLPAAKRDLLFTPNLDDYGYGWVIQKRSGVMVEWHNGALSPLGFTALVARVPSKDRFVGYLANLDLALIEPFEAKVEALAVK